MSNTKSDDSNDSNDSNDQNEQIEIMDFTESKISAKKKVEELNFDAISKYLNTESINSRLKWSKADEKIVQKYIFKALCYKTLYNKSYFRYSFFHKILTWPLVFMTCVSIGLQMIFATIITTDTVSENNGILSIITTCASICVSILTYLQARTSFNDLANGCRKAGIEFSEYADQLNTILTIKKEYRANPLEVIKIMQADYKKITKVFDEYEIPSSIYSNFINKHKNNELIIDIATSNTEHFNLYDGTLEKNTIVNKFLNSIADLNSNNND